MFFDFESATTFEVDPRGILRITSDGHEHVLHDAGVTVPPVPPSVEPLTSAIWWASAFCCALGVVLLLMMTAVLGLQMTASGQLTNLVLIGGAAAAWTGASVSALRRSRAVRPEQQRAAAQIAATTGIPLSVPQARRLVSGPKNFIRLHDGVLWAVHDGALFRGGVDVRG